MAAKAYAAIDLGAESGRVMVGVLDGGKLTLHEVHRFIHLPRRLPSGLHWDLVGLWGNILDGVKSAVAWSREHDVPLTSIGVDTWGVDWALLGEAGELLGLPHCYRDEAHLKAYEQTIAAVGKEYLFDVTGIQFMWLNTLYQVVARHAASPTLFDHARHMLFIPDLINYFFTGKVTVEFSIASTSQMLDARTGKWSTDLMGKLGLPTHMLGPIVPPGTKIGTLLPHVAEYTGAEPDLAVIAPATHDTASAVAAVPADAATNWAYLSSGTWSLMGAELNEPCLTPAARDVPFTNEGGVDGTVRFLKNIAGLWLVQESRRQYDRDGATYDYTQLTEMAAAAEPFRTLIDPDCADFVPPGDMPGRIVKFAKQTQQPPPTEPGQIVRCCLESLALTYRRTLERLEKVLDRRFDVLHIVGGGGKNQLLNQMTADAIGRRVVVGPDEATAAGNVLVQAMGAGDVKDLPDLRKIVAASYQPKTYHPKDPAAWDGAYERFLNLLGK